MKGHFVWEKHLFVETEKISKRRSLWWVGGNPGHKFIEDIIVYMLRGKLFVLEASYFSSNVVAWLTKAEYYVFFCFFSDFLIINKLLRLSGFIDLTGLKWFKTIVI